MNQHELAKAFNFARLKIQRAYTHFQEAERLWVEYLKTDFCVLREERNPETGNQEFFVQSTPLPAELSLALGDGFHNMSAALDYVMSGMMRAAGQSATRIGFPSDETRHGLRKSFMAPKAGKRAPPNRRIVETFPRFVWLLLMKIKPYRGGDHLLWEMRKADNIDKHNLIIPSVAITELRGALILDAENNNSVGIGRAAVEAGGRVNLVFYSGKTSRFEITHKGQPTAQIAFPKSLEIFAGEPVFPTAIQCVKRIEEAISLIESDGTARPLRTRARSV